MKIRWQAVAENGFNEDAYRLEMHPAGEGFAEIRRGPANERVELAMDIDLKLLAFAPGFRELGLIEDELANDEPLLARQITELVFDAPEQSHSI